MPSSLTTQRFRQRIKHALLKVPLFCDLIRNRVRRTFTEDQLAIVNGIDESSLVFDIGANRGLYSDFFASCGANVVAFEPNPFVFAELNKRKLPGVIALNYGADTVATKKKLFHHELAQSDHVQYSESSSFLEDKPNVTSNDSSLVSTIDLAAFINQFPTEIYLLKVDIEGYEVELLPHLLRQGALEKIRYCFVETHEKKFPKLAEATQRMKDEIVSSETACQVMFDWH